MLLLPLCSKILAGHQLKILSGKKQLRLPIKHRALLLLNIQGELFSKRTDGNDRMAWLYQNKFADTSVRNIHTPKKHFRIVEQNNRMSLLYPMIGHSDKGLVDS